MALTKVITGVTDLNQAQSTNGLKFPTGNVFAGTPEEGMIRNDQSQASEGSASTMQFYNGTAWKNFVNKVSIPLGTDNFNTVLYTGNGSTQNVGGVGFQPDLTWIKSRNATGSHIVTDVVRGNGKELYPDLTNAEGTVNRISLISDGFSVTSAAYPNINNNTYVAWNWKAGGAAVSNTDGTITSDVSANTAAGFSIVSYTGNGGSATLGSGLSQQVEMVICKSTESTSQWITYHKDLTGNVSGDNPYNLYLNDTNTQMDLTAFGAYNSFTSSVFPVTRQSASTAHNNNLNIDYIAYCWHSVAGYQKVGSYNMNGSALTIDLGFAPRFFLYKEATRNAPWVIADNLRSAGGDYKKRLYPDLSIAESTNQVMQFSGNTVILNYGTSGNNATSGTGIYLAIA